MRVTFCDYKYIISLKNLSGHLFYRLRGTVLIDQGDSNWISELGEKPI